MINVRTVGARETARAFELSAATADERAAKVVRRHGLLLVTRIKGRASGRPGPRVITGDYRRSWTLETGTRGGAQAAIAGTNAPQGARLENGFVGVDSLGRHYDQPPFPHVRPAVAETEPGFLADLAREAAR